jgi:pimeloyl-ACP methyl ester carboxylesterase
MKTVLSKDGTPIAYNQTGSGFPLILVDGALCSSVFGPMPALVPLLEPHFTVICYDRRGRNESGDIQPYTPQREVEDIEALIDVVGGSAYVFGLSSGAALSINAAASGLGIKKLALYEPPYMVDKDGHKPPADSEAQLKTLIATGNRGGAVKFFIGKMVGVPPFAVFMMGLMPMFRKLKAVAHTLVYDAAILGDFSMPAKKVAAIKIPTFVAGGEKSPPALRHAVVQLAPLLADNEFHMLKGQTHRVDMKILAPLLIEFFKK